MDDHGRLMARTKVFAPQQGLERYLSDCPFHGGLDASRLHEARGSLGRIPESA
jgi:hypothetical protein